MKHPLIINPTRRDAVPDVQASVCPYCGDDPATVTTRDMVFPSGLVALVFSCGNIACRKVLTMQAINVVQNEKPRVEVPS